jgi:hypothetical protein
MNPDIDRVSCAVNAGSDLPPRDWVYQSPT